MLPWLLLLLPLLLREPTCRQLPQLSRHRGHLCHECVQPVGLFGLLSRLLMLLLLLLRGPVSRVLRLLLLGVGTSSLLVLLGLPCGWAK